MRIERLFLVKDPEPTSDVEDILTEVTTLGLLWQFRNNVEDEDHPALYGSREEAELDARGRILVLRAREALAGADQVALERAARIEIRGADGALLFAVQVG